MKDDLDKILDDIGEEPNALKWRLDGGIWIKDYEDSLPLCDHVLFYNGGYSVPIQFQTKDTDLDKKKLYDTRDFVQNVLRTRVERMRYVVNKNGYFSGEMVR